jgi:CRISPR/Cas system-associated protein Cas5 (RAMP superfamily)
LNNSRDNISARFLSTPTEAKVEEVAVLRITATSSRSTSNALDELPRELAMLRPSDECRRRAKKAQTLAAQTQDDWEKELLTASRGEVVRIALV